jgi:hypothetical protein
LERDDTGSWSHHWAKGFCHLRYLPGFHGDEDDIYNVNLLRVVCRLDGVEGKVAKDTVDPQSLGL